MSPRPEVESHHTLSALKVSKMSAIDQITSLLETMSFAEKLSLNERIATAIRKEGGKAGSKKAAKTDDGEAKPKRKAAAGTLAWQAFVKHIKTTQPDAFDGITKESDKLQIVKGIRAEDMPAYETFVAEWKTNYAATQGEVDDEVEEAEEVVAAPKAAASPVTAAMTPAQKIAALKAAKAAATAAPAAPPAPAKKEVKKAAAKPAAKAEAKPAAKPKAAAKKAEAKEEAKQLPILVLEEVEYWHDEETQGLWKKEADTFSGDNWTGYYQPGNEEEPIRYTENFGDE